MELQDKIEILGKAFANGEVDALEDLLNENCTYNSDYAHKRMTSANEIIDSMRRVHAAVQKQIDEGKDCSYTYKIVQLDTLFKNDTKLENLHGETLYSVCETGLLLYQYGDENPVAVVFVKTNPAGYITEINLSRNHKWFDLNFYSEDGLEDSEKDIPYTVKPMSSHDRQVKELQSVLTHQNHEFSELDDTEVYVWRKADGFIKQWLKGNGYYVIESRIFDDCIGYRCNRKGYVYTVYMYAYGQSKTAQLDGDYCGKPLENEFSANSTVLVVFLNVRRFKDGDEVRYSVCNYSGDEDHSIEMWRINEVNEKKILEFYPRKEMMDATYRLMYAFNRDDRDVYDCIICDKNPAFDGINSTGIFMNDAFYTNMFRLHKEHGNMKIGYVSFNDVMYSKVPYIDGYGFFSFSVDSATDKIKKVTAFPFDGGERKVAEFIKTEEQESGDWYAGIPAAIAVEPMKPIFTERFALKITFDNREVKKYVLPIDDNYEKDEVVSFDRHVFTDKIWSTALIEKSAEAHRGMAIHFVNDYSISVLKCYEEGTKYVEPDLCRDVVYEDDEYAVEKCWKWNVNSIYEDEETGILMTLISGTAFNNYGTSTFASKEGKRICSIDFEYIGSFHEGLARVCKSGYGYGFVDKDMNLVIPMIYENADKFKAGKAKVKRDGRWMYVDKTGHELEIETPLSNSKYEEVGEFNEGMCKVSTLKLGFMDLAYHSDYAEIAGTWGFINENGVEVVAPQYIYAEDFSGGIAVVCKGKWTIDKKWDNKYNTGRYWTEEELWGAIDKDGNEVVPFIFDEIKYFCDVDDVFMVHYGGWKEGRWGVIDNHGKWLAEPIFEDIDYAYHDGMFAFYKENKWESDDVPLGIYDIKQHKIIFEPQFYDVSFHDDDWIRVETFDEQLGRRVEKLIDRNGNEKFHSIYSSIYTWKNPYEVVIRDEKGDRHGLIDVDGTVILPCEYDVKWDGISCEQKLMVFKEGEHQGIKDFNGNIIIEPKYYEIYNLDCPMLTVRVGEKDNYTEGLISKIGKEVIPAEYEGISWLKDNYFVCCKKGLCEMYHLNVK